MFFKIASRYILFFVFQLKLVAVLLLFSFALLQLPLACSPIVRLNYAGSDSRVVIHLPFIIIMFALGDAMLITNPHPPMSREVSNGMTSSIFHLLVLPFGDHAIFSSGHHIWSNEIICSAPTNYFEGLPESCRSYFGDRRCSSTPTSRVNVKRLSVVKILWRNKQKSMATSRGTKVGV